MNLTKCFVMLLSCGIVSGSRRNLRTKRQKKLDIVDEVQEAFIEESSMSFEYTTTEATTIQPISLIDTSWKALDINNNEPINQITLSITSGGVNGYTGCNMYRGKGELSDSEDTLTFGTDFAITKMVCLQDGLMEQETNYLNFMSSNTYFYELVDEELVFYDYTNGTQGEIAVARFERCDDPKCV